MNRREAQTVAFLQTATLVAKRIGAEVTNAIHDEWGVKLPSGWTEKEFLKEVLRTYLENSPLSEEEGFEILNEVLTSWKKPKQEPS